MKRVMGCDIAEMGKDFTVITIIEKKEDIYRIIDIVSWSKMETMPTVGKITNLIQEYKPDKIMVDATGIGNGVWSRLKEQDYPAQKLLVGSSPTTEKQRFANLKAQIYWNLRNLFEEGRIKIPKEPKLIEELNKMKYEITSAGKIKITDPEKSPDFADSLAYAIAGYNLWGETIVLEEGMPW